MGLLDYDDVQLKKQSVASLSGKATQLLTKNGMKKKRRRGSGIKKKNTKQLQHQKDMEQYRKQKRERCQMFRDFERLITE